MTRVTFEALKAACEQLGHYGLAPELWKIMMRTAEDVIKDMGCLEIDLEQMAGDLPQIAQALLTDPRHHLRTEYFCGECFFGIYQLRVLWSQEGEDGSEIARLVHPDGHECKAADLVFRCVAWQWLFACPGEPNLGEFERLKLERQSTEVGKIVV